MDKGYRKYMAGNHSYLKNLHKRLVETYSYQIQTPNHSPKSSKRPRMTPKNTMGTHKYAKKFAIAEIGALRRKSGFSEAQDDKEHCYEAMKYQCEILARSHEHSIPHNLHP